MDIKKEAEKAFNNLVGTKAHFQKPEPEEALKKWGRCLGLTIEDGLIMTGHPTKTVGEVEKLKWEGDDLLLSVRVKVAPEHRAPQIIIH